MKRHINKAFLKAIEKAETDRPTLYILRGFTELVSKIKIPSDLEAFDPYDLDGNYPRYILAEMFQILCLDDEIYEEVEEHSYFSPELAPANVKDDTHLSLMLFSLSLMRLTDYKYSKTLKNMIKLNYDFVTIDFNLYDGIGPDGQQAYFPINYEAELHEDIKVFSDLKYPGLFEYSNHQQGMIKYFDTVGLVSDRIKVFDDDEFVKQLLTYSSKYNDMDKEITDAFFNYFSVYEKLN